LDLNVFGLFLVTCFLLSMTPGPNMLSALDMGIRHGLSGAAWGGAGMCLALGGLAGLSALGAGVVLAASPLAFLVLKVAGAAYLLWLGLQAWRAPVDGDLTEAAAEQADGRTGSRWFILLGQGVLITSSNPKALIFMAAFFPQFIDPANPLIPQLSLLITGMLVIEFGWIMAYAAGGRGLTVRLQGRQARRLLNRISGGLLMAAALSLSLTRL
jgi:homoserine/homoserine lactone efflux protein